MAAVEISQMLEKPLLAGSPESPDWHKCQQNLLSLAQRSHPNPRVRFSTYPQNILYLTIKTPYQRYFVV